MIVVYAGVRLAPSAAGHVFRAPGTFASGALAACLTFCTHSNIQSLAEYLVLLPECLPFLSELLEDANSDVESQCRRVLKLAEELSGEDLDHFL